jgi:hypothetical protein
MIPCNYFGFRNFHICFASGTHWAGYRVIRRAGVNAVGIRKFTAPNEIRTPGAPHIAD